VEPELTPVAYVTQSISFVTTPSSRECEGVDQGRGWAAGMGGDH
jgi:hypothetical protein